MSRLLPLCCVAAQVLAHPPSAARAYSFEATKGGEPGRSDEPSPRHKRGPGVESFVGAVAGLSLGLALGDRSSGGPRSPLQGLGAGDAIVSGAALALFASPRLFDRSSSTAPDVGAPPHELNGFDRSIRKLALGHRSAASRDLLDRVSWGTLTATVVAPVGLLAASDVPEKWERDLPVVMEATVSSLALTVAVKHVFHRSRPRDRFCADADSQEPCRVDTRESFYSGHTSAAFAAAIATGSIANYHGLENRGWIWGSQLTLATATGVLRVMSDRHYATDVIVGMATGGLIGWLIPRWHKPDEARVVPLAAPPRRSAALTTVPIAVGSGTMAVTAGMPAGGGWYVGLRWHER